MTEPGKHQPHGPSNPSAGSPKGAPAKKCLHALFGNYCRTETYATPDQGRGPGYVHCEAYMDDPVKKTWTVTKVSRQPKTSISINPYARKIATHTQRVASGVSFRDALEQMAAFERDCLGKKTEFTPSLPGAANMGFTHFKAFSEREGYVFDQGYHPLPRPAREALPPEADFYESDVESADKNVARPVAEFDNNGPASRAPNAHFLLDHFTQAAHSYDYNSATAALRVLNILDRFAGQVEKAHAKLTEYCEKYQELGHGDLITEALTALSAADGSVRQMKAYGVDVTEFESFVLQCQVTCHVLHAEGLYSLMNANKGDFESNETLFKSRVSEAAEAFSKIDPTPEGAQSLKNMIVQAKAPAVPPTIGLFVERYKELRSDYTPPEPPLPPRRKPNSPRP